MGGLSVPWPRIGARDEMEKFCSPARLQGNSGAIILLGTPSGNFAHMARALGFYLSPPRTGVLGRPSVSEEVLGSE